MPGDEKLFSIVDAPPAPTMLPSTVGASLDRLVTPEMITMPNTGTADAGARGVLAGVGAGEPSESRTSTALFGLSPARLAELVAGLGQPAYRARQLEQALYRQWVSDFDDVSTLPRSLRQALTDGGYQVGLPQIVETFRSVDGTERYLIAGLDGQTVETVWMPGGDGGEHAELDGGEAENEEEGASAGPAVPGSPAILGQDKDQRSGRSTRRRTGSRNRQQGARFDVAQEAFQLELDAGQVVPPGSVPRERPAQRRATICVSSQIGCAVNCQFCLTAKLGILRNLSAGEIAGQVVAALKRQGVHLGRDRINLVFMGMGEPFLNYDAFIAALHLLTDSVGLAASRMTVSTSGIVPGILRFAQEPMRCKLAISLNASNDVVREQIMPITRKWNIEAVLDAVRTIPLGPRERITFEYVLLGGVNDRPEHADEVIRLVRTAGFACYVNLIVWNPGPGTPYTQPDQAAVDAFQHRLISQGVTAYIRRPRGRDIYAACGQLKNTTT